MTSAGPKRSLFSKPSWATSAAAPIGKPDDDAIFGRSSGQIYEDIIAEKRKKKEKQAEKAKAARTLDGREPKRRRISDEHEDGSDSDAASSKSDHSEESLKKHVRKAGPVTRNTPTKRKFAAALDSPVKPVVSRPSQSEAAPISPDEDDDLQIIGVASASKATRASISHKAVIDDPESDPESDDDDEYIQDLKRRAKAVALPQKQADTTKKPPVDVSASTTKPLELTQGSPSALEGEPQKDQGQRVSLLITSIYPNTKPLIVGYYDSKPLRQARQIWCLKQGFSDEKTETFFLTWNGAKLFDSSTLIKSNIMKSLQQQRPDEDNPSGGKVHLEAMNAEIMEHRQKQKERAEAEAEAGGSSAGDAGDEAAAAEPALPPEPKFVISLQAQDMEPFRLSVRPSTEIFKIMGGFHKHQGVEEGRVCWLVFDGNRLEPNSTIRDAEIEEDDVVEVHIR